jgi:hypothetical protein
MKLAGGSAILAPQLNLEAFIDQARDYHSISDNELGAMLKSMQTEQLTHPVPVLRAKEIDRWATTQAYQDLLKGDRIGLRVNKVEDSEKGGWRNW